MLPQAEKMAEADHERYQQTAEPHGRKKSGNLCGNGKTGERNNRAQTVWLDNENQRKRQIKRCKKKRRPQIRQEAEQHVPDGARVQVVEAGQQITVQLAVDARWGALGPIEIEGRATAPTAGR